MPFLLHDTRVYQVAKNRETLLNLEKETQQRAIGSTNPLAVIMPRHGYFVLVAIDHENVLVNDHLVNKMTLLRHGDRIDLGAGNPLYFYNRSIGICPICRQARSGTKKSNRRL